MKRTILGVFLGGLAVYMWGFAYWGASGIPYAAWKQAAGGDEAVQQALLEHFPENGTYFVPGMYNEDAELDRLMEAGPVALVHMTAREGRPMMLTSVMVCGFGLCLLVAALTAALLRMARIETYGRRVAFVAMVGLTAVVTIHLGDVVWWMLPLDWKLAQAFYDLAAFGILGAVLGKFTAAPIATG